MDGKESIGTLGIAAADIGVKRHECQDEDSGAFRSYHRGDEWLIRLIIALLFLALAFWLYKVTGAI
jgi:hypothetical protein